MTPSKRRAPQSLVRKLLLDFARRRLPDYEIANVRTGQYDAAAGELWSVEFPLPRAVH